MELSLVIAMITFMFGIITLIIFGRERLIITIPLFAIFVLALTYFLVFEQRVNNHKKLIENEKFVIVGANESPDVTPDKFRRPTSIKVWLIQRINDPTQFAELRSDRGAFRISNELWYNKSEGDTLYFEYIAKYRFFTIKNFEKNK